MATILVVDDDAGVRNFVRLALGDTGHEVLEAGDGADALRQARGGAIDLVLCDLFMPGTDGLETIRALRRECPDLKIAAMSGGGFHGKVDMLPVAQRLGASAILYKPFKQETLLRTVARLLSGAVVSTAP